MNRQITVPGPGPWVFEADQPGVGRFTLRELQIPADMPTMASGMMRSAVRRPNLVMTNEVRNSCTTRAKMLVMR